MRGLGTTGTNLVLKMPVSMERHDSFGIYRVEDRVRSWAKQRLS